MSDQWIETTIGEVSETIFSGGTPTTRNPDYWDGPFCWLSSGETRNRFITSTEKSITELGIKESSTRLAKINDIVIASAGQGHTRGQSSYLKIDTYINQSLVAIRANQKVIDPYFLFYNLQNRYDELRQHSDGNSSRGSITTKMIKEFPIVIPPLVEQKKIVSIIKDMEDQISINIEMNKTLQEMAMTLYKNYTNNN